MVSHLSLRRSIFVLAALAVIASTAYLAGDALAQRRSSGLTLDVPSDDRTIAHVLGRLGFGPRSGDVERVRRMGLAAYIEQQLHPEKLTDTAVDARLGGLQTLHLSTRELAEQYYLPALMERRERQRQQATAGQSITPPDAPAPSPPDSPARNAVRPSTGSGLRVFALRPGSPKPSAKAAGRTAGQTDAMRKERIVLAELNEQRIVRAVYSERQLQEVLVDFWFNHFNVFAGKGQTRVYLTEYERDTIRPRVLGKFRDLLGATAESPAMLFYLDNWMSVDPNAPDPRTLSRDRDRPGPLGRPGRFGFFRPGRPGDMPTMPGDRPAPNRQQQARRRGLNENYARELLELHTLGVDGGYTQQDVVEVARAFTGWTIDRPREGGSFLFEPRLHDNGEKAILGHRITGAGKRDGEHVLDILARHPSTARFIAIKLARRFVTDDPPQSLVDRAAARFQATDGDLREVVTTIVTSPEFFAAEARRAKVKTPFEFLASALRATGAEVSTAVPLARTLRDLGMPLYFCQPPTGYADRADAWVNTGALLARLNFALDLVSNRLRGVRVDEQGLAGGGGLEGARRQLVDRVLMADVSAETRATIAKATDVTQVAALAIGAPEFQRR